MFIAHSAARVRLVRTIFVLAGLIPCAAIVAWAVHLRSESRRESVRLAWQRTVGLPLAIGALESVRPGVVRARDCTLTAAEGAATISCAAVEVEVSATEVRLRIDRLRCDPAAARLLGFVAREWLERGARFDRDCVVEVADFAWSLPGGAGGGSPRGSRESAAAAVRIEILPCIADQVLKHSTQQGGLRLHPHVGRHRHVNLAIRILDAHLGHDFARHHRQVDRTLGQASTRQVRQLQQFVDVVAHAQTGGGNAFDVPERRRRQVLAVFSQKDVGKADQSA